MKILNNKREVNITPYSISKKIKAKPSNPENLFRDVMANPPQVIETQPDYHLLSPRNEERKAVAL